MGPYSVLRIEDTAIQHQMDYHIENSAEVLTLLESVGEYLISVFQSILQSIQSTVPSRIQASFHDSVVVVRWIVGADRMASRSSG